MSNEQGSESTVSRRQIMKEAEMAEEKEAPKKVSRREFVKGAAAVASVGALASCAPAATPGPGETAAPAATCPPAGECPTPWIPEKWDYEADVVVVGRGYAGLTASIAAHDAGSSVLVLEKAPEELSGGNSVCCSGSSRILGPAADHATFLKMQAWGTVLDDEVCLATAEAFLGLIDWLQGLGLTLDVTERVAPPREEAWTRFQALVDGFVSPEFGLMPGSSSQSMKIMKPDGNARGRDLWEAIRGVATARGIEPMFATPAKELIQDPVTKEILGVVAAEGATGIHGEGGKKVYVRAKKAVVLACGGLENNEQMTRNFMPSSRSNYVTPIGSRFNTGDGLYMATAVGAKLWHLNSAEIYIFACLPASKEMGNAVVTRADATDKAIWVNRFGKRFLNERQSWSHTKTTQAYDAFLYKNFPQDDEAYCDYPNQPYYMIFDDTLMAERLGYPSYGEEGYTYKGGFLAALNLHRWSDDNSEELAKGWIIKADTIEELGKKIVTKNFWGQVVGMDAAGLVETVNEYNEYCALGEDPDFARYPDTLVPINKPPFYAIELCGAQLNTNGGPMHDKYARTLDANENPIPRLYSAGELGSIYGHLYMGAGNVPEALSMGRVAGEHAAGLEALG